MFVVQLRIIKFLSKLIYKVKIELFIILCIIQYKVDEREIGELWSTCLSAIIFNDAIITSPSGNICSDFKHPHTAISG